jgi:SAM-dependent methyltransferase
MRSTKEDIVRSFQTAYKNTPAWEIGRPQREIIMLETAGEIHGRILDVGCGTGDNTLYLAQQGYEVFGIDVASAAVDKARKKATVRHAKGLFIVHDALSLDTLGIKFDTIVDSGLFHVFSNHARLKFVQSIRSSLRVRGTYLMLCFSEHEPDGWGPRRVTQEEIIDSFSEGFKINYIREAIFETNRPQSNVKAWLASMKRI